MAKYKEIVSMVLDKLKITSDDSVYTEDHIIFLAGRYRSFLIKQRYYSDLKKQIPESNYQTLCLNLEPAEAVKGFPCYGYYLRTVQEIPDILPCGNVNIYTSDSYQLGGVTLISKERMKYIGNNKWTKNIIYACFNPDNKIYLYSSNPQFKYLTSINVQAMFENAEEASDYECNNQEDSTKKCEILERDFPLEDALIAPLLELVVNNLAPSVAAPEDKENNANDNLSQEAK